MVSFYDVSATVRGIALCVLAHAYGMGCVIVASGVYGLDFILL